MFDLQPPRHISTLRVSLVAARPGDRLLSEPTAAAQPGRGEPSFVPHSGPSAAPEAMPAHVKAFGGRPVGTGSVGSNVADPRSRCAGPYADIGAPLPYYVTYNGEAAM